MRNSTVVSWLIAAFLGALIAYFALVPRSGNLAGGWRLPEGGVLVFREVDDGWVAQSGSVRLDAGPGSNGTIVIAVSYSGSGEGLGSCVLKVGRASVAVLEGEPCGGAGATWEEIR